MIAARTGQAHRVGMRFATASVLASVTAPLLLTISVAGAIAADVVAFATHPSSVDAPAEPAPAPFVRYRNGRLSVRAEGVPLAELLPVLEAEIGVRFDGAAVDQRRVWKRFEDVLLADGLRRVIGRQSFTLTYGETGDPLRVELLAAPEPPPIPRPAKGPAPSFTALLLREPPIPASARLAAALGSARTIPLIQLWRAFRVEDPAVRGDAVDAFLLALRRNPTLRATFVALPEASVVAFVHAWAGTHGGDVMRAIAARALHADLRDLARRALDAMPVG